MRRMCYLGVSALLLCLPFKQDQLSAQRTQAAKHGWLSNLEQAKAAARKDGKPMMVVFRCEP